jgi:hypothetical protein
LGGGRALNTPTIIIDMVIGILIGVAVLVIVALLGALEGATKLSIGLRWIDFKKTYFLLGVLSESYDGPNKNVIVDEVAIGIFFVELVFFFEKINYFPDNEE